MQEKIVEIKKCGQCNSDFEITDKDLEFYDKISPIFKGNKFEIPIPSLCPDCRLQRRLSYRLESKLYRRKCDATGKNLISMYSPDKKDIVYDYDYWWSDKWEALDYGVNFDFKRPFFEQFNELSKKTPKAHIEISPSENSEYTNQAGFNKNCYLTFDSGYNEDCMYSKSIRESKYTLDSCFVQKLENCYECIECDNSFNLFYSQKSSKCNNGMYLYDCHNCDNCIGSWNLNGKKYYVLNNKVTKQEYDNVLLQLNNDKNFKENLINEINKRKNLIVNKNLLNIGSENVIGNNIDYSKNCSGFNIKSSENCYYCDTIYDSKNCMDLTLWGNKNEKILDSISIGNSANNILFSYMCYNEINNLIYCMNCVNNSSNLFGCIGLKNKQYCIFNKQYSKEEYEELVPKIIKYMQDNLEWGEFFPVNLSPFGYNEVLAIEYFPLEKNEAIQKGFNWSDYKSPLPKVEKIIPADKLPENIKDIPDDILNWAIECEVTKKPFKVLKQELDFYRKYGISIPKIYPDQRHLNRIKKVNPRKIFDRKCDKCGIEIKTTFSAERKEKVYCEECYNKEVY